VDLEGRVRDRWRCVAQDRLEQLARSAGELEFAPHEDGVGAASNIREHVGAEIVRRADHVREPHEECAPLGVSFKPGRIMGTHEKSEEKGADEGSYESFNSLLRAELDERCAPERLAYIVS